MSKSSIREFRDKHFKQLEKSMAQAVKIRDGKCAVTMKCPYCKAKFDTFGSSARDRNEAIKIIARLLSALQPDKAVSQDPKQTKGGKVSTLSPDLMERIHREYGTTDTVRTDSGGEDPLP